MITVKTATNRALSCSLSSHLARVVRRDDLGVGEGAPVHAPPVLERDGVQPAQGHEVLYRVLGGQVPHLSAHVPVSRHTRAPSLFNAMLRKYVPIPPKQLTFPTRILLPQ